MVLVKIVPLIQESRVMELFVHLKNVMRDKDC